MKKENAIFRLQSIDNYLKRQNDYSEQNHDAIMMAIEALKEQKQHGEWIIRRDTRGKHIYSVCSRCNVPHLDTDLPNFCENCGSDNRKRGEAE